MFTNHFDVRTKDGLTLRGKSWSPDENPKKVICLVHGHGEHIGRYEHVASFFAQSGYAFYAVDMRGHGKSDGKKGHVPSYDLVMSDIEELIKVARLDHLDTPIVLYGHSLGGNFVVNFMLANKVKEVSKMIVSSPWLRLAITPPIIKVKMAAMMNRIWPSYTEHSNLDPTGLSYDKKVVQDYIDDPLVHDKISVRLFISATQAGETAIAKAREITIKTLVMHGKDDPITSFDASAEFAAKSHATFRQWEGMRHEPHNEVHRDLVLGYVLKWIENE